MAKGFEQNYSEQGIWDKLADCAKRIGKEAVMKILILIYALDDPQVPAKAKAVIFGALGYLISPLDAIPDMLPGGYVDDMAVIAAAVTAIMVYVSPATVNRAQKRVEAWFG